MASVPREGILVRAAAFKVKYAEKGEDGLPLLLTVPIMRTCAHPGNRGCVYTQGQACKTLLKSIGTEGFSQELANSPNTVVVRERPPMDRPVDYRTFLEHNMLKSSQDELLDGAYLKSDDVQFGNLSHCHMENVARAILRKLHWGTDVFSPDSGIRFCDIEGRLSLPALAANLNFSELGRFLETGFENCKVLSHKIDIEEPSAASAISAAANKGQDVAMQEHEWTAISTLNGLAIPANSNYSEAVVWSMFLDRATDVLGLEAVKHPLFKHVIRLVHQLGGNTRSYITDLVQFGETMVDSKKRRSSFKLYETACELPIDVPSVKVALIKNNTHCQQMQRV